MQDNKNKRNEPDYLKHQIRIYKYKLGISRIEGRSIYFLSKMFCNVSTSSGETYIQVEGDVVSM